MNLRQTLLAAVVLVCSVIANVFAQEVVLFDLDKAGMGKASPEENAALCVQGITNSTEPRVFYKRDTWLSKVADDVWQKYLEENKGFTFEEITDFRELISYTVKNGYAKGLVLYNPGNIDGAELIPALNIAVAEKRIPVTQAMLDYNTPALLHGSSDCFNALNIKDIQGKWKTKRAAKTWSLENQLKDKSKEAMFNACFPWRGASSKTGLDYAVGNNLYCFDLDVQDANENALYIKAMEYLDAPAMVLGGFRTERHDVGERVSKSGNYHILSDSSLNLSFLAKVPYNRANLHLGAVSKPTIKLDPNKYYVIIMINEGDTLKYLDNFYMDNWLSDARGKVKFAWAMPVGLVKFFPVIVEYYVTTRTENDSFFTGPDGPGYIHLRNMPDELILPYARLTDKLMRQLDIHAMEVWGSNETKLELFSKNAPFVKWFSCARDRNGMNEILSTGAFMTSNYSDADADKEQQLKNRLWYANCPGEDLVRRVRDFAAKKESPYFITIYGCHYKIGSTTLSLAHYLKENLPEEFELVTVEEFISLMNQHHKLRMATQQ